MTDNNEAVATEQPEVEEPSPEEQLAHLIANMLRSGQHSHEWRGSSIVRSDIWEVGQSIYIGSIGGKVYQLFISEATLSEYNMRKWAIDKAERNDHTPTDFAYCGDDNIGYVAMCTRCGGHMSVPKGRRPMGVLLSVVCGGTLGDFADD